MSSFGQKMRCGSGQLGFIAGTFTCYSLHCGNIIHRTNSFCPFRSSFFKVHTPFCASFRHQGMCKASLSSSPFSDSAEPDHELKANEHFNLHWMGILATFLVMLPETADASSLDTLKDIFKSKPASLLHPLVMLGVLGTSLYTFYLGYQSRRLREVDSETRKELVRGRYGQRHYQTSAILLAVLTFFTFEGMVRVSFHTSNSLFSLFDRQILSLELENYFQVLICMQV